MRRSLDGYTADASGDFSWAAPSSVVLNQAINELGASNGTYLCGRKMYDTMVYWKTADQDPAMDPVERQWAKDWQATEKIVYSRSLTETRSARTRIERDFDPEAVRQLKASATKDLAIAGPTLAAHAVRAGLVDEFQLIVCPVVVGGGTHFFPADVRLDLQPLDERKFADGTVILRYASRAATATTGWSSTRPGRPSPGPPGPRRRREARRRVRPA